MLQEVPQDDSRCCPRALPLGSFRNVPSYPDRKQLPITSQPPVLTSIFRQYLSWDPCSQAKHVMVRKRYSFPKPADGTSGTSYIPGEDSPCTGQRCHVPIGLNPYQ